MKPSLCITIRFIQPYPLYHGRTDGDEAEWPPSPMRLFQALLNAACSRTRGRPLAPEVRTALQVLEILRPSIVAPRATLTTTGHRAYVPHNHADLVAAAWDRGNFEANIAGHRVEKDHRPHRIEVLGDELPTLHYLYPLDATNADPTTLLSSMRPVVRSITHLGWGIDQVVADATLVDTTAPTLFGEHWAPSPRGGQRLRVHRQGSLDALHARHDRFLSRLTNGDWTNVPPLSAIDQVRYRRETDPLPRPHAVFKLIDENDDTVAYAQAKLVHIAGMVKHLAIEQMKRNPPRDLRGRTPEQWVEQYVAGHRAKEEGSAMTPHAQFSFIPLQSIGMEHTDPDVRRVMIVAPIGDDAWLDHLARQLDGMRLKPLPDTKLPSGTHLELIGEKNKDRVRDAYLHPSRTWASTTPVILPGHDDHKPEKTRKLIEKALAQSGIDQPCEFEWSAFSHFRKMLGAHKYVRDDQAKDGKRRINYIRPDHLLDQTAVHLRLTFTHPIPGPLTLGAGRHCGFGLMAAVKE